MSELFRKLSHRVSTFVGTPFAFFLALLILLIWIISGPIYKFSDTWQLVINTGTTIITFLIVFLIQNTQNRDTKAINIKLDELIRAGKQASNNMIDIEELNDEQLNQLEDSFRKIAHKREGSIKIDERETVEIRDNN
jgi:low affinity Fe/Cu permease